MASPTSGRVQLDIAGRVATITTMSPANHNAFDDVMDREFFDILDGLTRASSIRAIIWQAEGPSFSSGRDTRALNGSTDLLSQHERSSDKQRGARLMLGLAAPVVVAMQGWAIGVSFQRALLADIRIASEDARFRLPELQYGVIPDNGGVARLYQMCGHGIVSDLVLTGRTMQAQEALAHGIVSRVVPSADLRGAAQDMANRIAAAPVHSVRAARRVIAHLSQPSLERSLDEELLAQTVAAGLRRATDDQDDT